MPVPVLVIVRAPVVPRVELWPVVPVAFEDGVMAVVAVMLAVETACPGGTAGRKTAGEQGGNGKQGEGKLAHGSVTSQSPPSTAARLALLSQTGRAHVRTTVTKALHVCRPLL